MFQEYTADLHEDMLIEHTSLVRAPTHERALQDCIELTEEIRSDLNVSIDFVENSYCFYPNTRFTSH